MGVLLAADIKRTDGAASVGCRFPGTSSSRCWITSPAQQLYCSPLLGSARFATSTEYRSWSMEPTHLAMYYQTSTFLPLVQIGTPVRLTNLRRPTAARVTRVPACTFMNRSAWADHGMQLRVYNSLRQSSQMVLHSQGIGFPLGLERTAARCPRGRHLSPVTAVLLRVHLL